MSWAHSSSVDIEVDRVMTVQSKNVPKLQPLCIVDGRLPGATWSTVIDFAHGETNHCRAPTPLPARGPSERCRIETLF